MQLFYQADIQKDTKAFTFDKIESRHIVRVLRKKEGDLLQITNGKQLLFTAEIIDANEKKCSVRIIKTTEKKSGRNFKLSIAIAPTKSNDRFEWFLEKATEIGIDEIYPIICKHSERKIIKPERLQKILVTAMKQSLQYKLPVLHEALSFNEFMAVKRQDDKFIAYCESDKGKSSRNDLKTSIKIGRDTCILVGPEGDFSPDEISAALHNEFIPVSLGATRLRTETAGIVAVHTVNLLNDNL